jgi:hypothetical protein
VKLLMCGCIEQARHQMAEEHMHQYPTREASSKNVGIEGFCRWRLERYGGEHGRLYGVTRSIIKKTGKVADHQRGCGGIEVNFCPICGQQAIEK